MRLSPELEPTFSEQRKAVKFELTIYKLRLLLESRWTQPKQKSVWLAIQRIDSSVNRRLFVSYNMHDVMNSKQLQ